MLEGRCPRCGYAMNAATTIDDETLTPLTPKPGDVALCLICAAPLGYTRSGSLRWLTYDEVFNTIDGEPEIRAKLVMMMLGILTFRPSRVRAGDPSPAE
jgi:hypothetical protein